MSQIERFELARVASGYVYNSGNRKAEDFAVCFGIRAEDFPEYFRIGPTYGFVTVTPLFVTHCRIAAGLARANWERGLGVNA